FVYAAGETFGFNLNNSSKALAATLECTKRYMGRTTPQVANNNPFRAPQPANTNGAREDRAEYRAEATVLLANILSAAGIVGFQVIPRDKIPSDLSRYDAVWTADNVIGAVSIILPGAAKGPEDITSFLMTADAQSCKGVFASGRYPTQAD